MTFDIDKARHAILDFESVSARLDNAVARRDDAQEVGANGVAEDFQEEITEQANQLAEASYRVLDSLRDAVTLVEQYEQRHGKLAPPAPPTETGWIVLASSPGMPLDDSEDSPRTGVNMTPCDVEEARNAVGTVRDDELFRAIPSMTDAFRVAVENHPSKVYGDREMAAYILDHGDGTYSVAV